MYKFISKFSLDLKNSGIQTFTTPCTSSKPTSYNLTLLNNKSTHKIDLVYKKKVQVPKQFLEKHFFNNQHSQKIMFLLVFSQLCSSFSTFLVNFQSSLDKLVHTMEKNSSNYMKMSKKVKNDSTLKPPFHKPSQLKIFGVHTCRKNSPCNKKCNHISKTCS